MSDKYEESACNCDQRYLRAKKNAYCEHGQELSVKIPKLKSIFFFS